MDKYKKALFWVVIAGIVLSLILEFVTVCTNLSIKTLEHQKLQWQLDTAKQDNKLVRQQIENELTRYRVYKTLEQQEEK